MFHKRILNESKKIGLRYGRADSRLLHITGAAGVFSVILGLGKIVSGIMATSVFVCMNGGYTLGMAMARYCALLGAVRGTDEKAHCKYYKISGLIMIGASILYVFYSIWSIWNPKTVYYGDIIPITIATITFTEIGLNV